MKKAILVDDESRARKLLSSLLRTHCAGQIEIVGEADSLDTALELISKVKIDVLFLDIQLKTHTGFELLNRLETWNFQVIFVTAYDQYALRALRLSALDYLLKPIKVTELSAAVKRLESLSQPNPEHRKAQKAILQEGLQASQAPKRIVLPNMEGYAVLKLNEVLYLASESNYTHVFTTQGKKHTVSKTLKEYEELLQRTSFYRIHHSYLINMDHISGYIRGDGGSVRLSNGVELPVSRNRKQNLIARLTKL